MSSDFIYECHETTIRDRRWKAKYGFKRSVLKPLVPNVSVEEKAFASCQLLIFFHICHILRIVAQNLSVLYPVKN